ncbi:hypothetical protein GCM10017691_11080 [Pseudonocardia petroleophila]|uniref:hypothetical protein n=1 Tax=Pseudonocardia petroleophila TaxID=37331 RepID=UPI001C8B9657|nr:hypothetical protein [Pseudonocardia petroleophila]
MTGCGLWGHRYRFRADGATMRWECARGCGAGGSKVYPDGAAAARFAAAFDREDRADLGRRAPLVGLLPLRLWRAVRRRGTHWLGHGPGRRPARGAQELSHGPGPVR